jgi:hypothetical protein
MAHQHLKGNIVWFDLSTCSFGWWLMAGAGLL